MYDAHLEIRSHLSEHYLFRGLSARQLQRVAERTRRIPLKENDWLFGQGEYADRFFLVVRGQVRLFFLTPQGDEKVVEVVGPGGTIAEALMFLSLPRYPVSASALDASEVLCLDARDFLIMLQDSKETCFALLGNLSRRIHSLVHEIQDLSLRSASCRVAAYILRSSEPDSTTFRLDIPKGVLASRLSVKPETLSRIIRQLRAKRIIAVRGSRIEILDRQALATQAEVCHEFREGTAPPEQAGFVSAPLVTRKS